MRTLASILLGLVLTGCSLPTAAAPGDDPDVEGVIIGLLPDGRALIDATRRPSAYPDTFYVNPAAEIIVRGPEGSVRTGTVADLRVGDHLRAWLVGIVLKSLPPQYPARTVEVGR